MSESINENSDLKEINNSKRHSLFSEYIKKNNIIATKKNKKYIFPKIPRLTKEDKIREGFILFLALISYILYYLSLGGCDGTQTECLKNSNIAYYYVLVNYCFISAGLTTLIIFLMVYTRVTKLHLIHQVIIFSILFISDRGSTLMHHGIYNIIGFSLFLIFYFIFLFIVVMIDDILLKRSLPIKLVVINIIILILIFWRYSFHESLKKECDDWDMGLNNTRIEDNKDKYPCQIFRPTACHINYFHGKQDLSRLLKLNCSNYINSNQALNSRTQLIKYIDKKEFENTTKFGFPLTNTQNFIITPEITPNIFTRKVYDNIIDMDNKSRILKPNEYPEVILTFTEASNEYKKKDNSSKFIGKININLQKNEELSSSRKKFETPDSIFNNIIMIYTDAVSRAHFKRNMPKTCAFIEKLMKNNFENDYIDYKNKFNISNENINNINISKQNIFNNTQKLNTLKKPNINNLKNRIFNNATTNIITKNLNKKVIPINKVNKRPNIHKSKIIKKTIIPKQIPINLNKSNLMTNKNLNNSTNNINHTIHSNKFTYNNEGKNIMQRNKNLTKEKICNNQNNSINKITTKTEIKNIDNRNKILSKEKLIKERLQAQNQIIKNNSYKNIINATKINNERMNIQSQQSIRKLEVINITNYFENKYYAYQFLKYHTFNSGTKFNAMPMFYGTAVFNTWGTNIIKYFQDHGYITAQSNDMCSKEVWEPEKEPPNLNLGLWDHENVAMFCDPSYMDRKSLYSIYKGVYSLLRRCFYGKEVHDYILEYGKQFWEAYPDNKKFLRLVFNDGHESTFEVLKYLDEPLSEFLKYFFEKGYLKNTALFIISDHGNHMPGIYNLFFSDQYETERVLANFYLIINSGNLLGDKLNKFRLYNNNAMENQQSLITPYDIHDTLMHIIHGDKFNKDFSMKGKSVFKKINYNERSCKFFDQDNEEKELCRCIPNSKYEKFVYYEKNK